jgi:hypothetical protein
MNPFASTSEESMQLPLFCRVSNSLINFRGLPAM